MSYNLHPEMLSSFGPSEQPPDLEKKETSNLPKSKFFDYQYFLVSYHLCFVTTSVKITFCEIELIWFIFMSTNLAL